MTILEYKYGTPLYDLSIRLRDKILKAPLGIEFDEEELMNEWKCYHLGAFDENMNLKACLVLEPTKNKVLKMRQVAVDEAFQSKGIGSLLVRHSEKFSIENGYHELVLNARDSAIEFYMKMDYKKIGKEFKEVGIPHFQMTKMLR